MDVIIKKLCLIAKALNANFTLHSKPITYEEVFSAIGLLPAIAKRADQLSSLCMGYGIGVTFEDATEAKLGIKAKFDEVTPNTLRYLCITDVICELMRASYSKDTTPLDELMYD
jgi:intracellular multiplication protein IcmS